MKWLQWSDYDLEGGLGGVEVHARCLNRELRVLGVDAHLSKNSKDLNQDWDVIQTHGSSPLPRFFHLKTNAFRHKRGPVLLHTLHGTTLGRMSACGEWLWPGGYLAYGREFRAVTMSHGVLAVHPALHLLSVARQFRIPSAICWNGWDSAQTEGAIPPSLVDRLDQEGPFFCYIGRGDDPVKNTGLILETMRRIPHLKLVAIPGAGFPEDDRIIPTGRLDVTQIMPILKKSLGLLLSSHYEGLPLVVLEALGQGVRVFATPAGGVTVLPPGLNGLYLTPPESEAWTKALQSASLDCVNPDRAEREHRALANRAILPAWKDVAQIALGLAERVRDSRDGRINRTQGTEQALSSNP